VTAVPVLAHHPGLVYAAALRGAPCLVHGLGKLPRRLPVAGWSGYVDAADRVLLEHCTEPVLDVGCGPGRMAEHLSRLGVEVLGVDLVPEAVRQTRVRGVPAVCADVFGPVPHEGHWATALLADGNVGIGGDPHRLLRRLHGLLMPSGRVVLDLAGPGTGLRTMDLVLECGERRSHPMPWAEVGPEAVADLAAETGFVPDVLECRAGRWFAVLRRRPG
jgi:SAM-dependent methyltransferase